MKGMLLTFWAIEAEVTVEIVCGGMMKSKK